MKRKKKPAWEGYAYMFHGSFSSKEKAESKAIMKVNLPALSAYYEQKSGRPVPMLAKGQ